MAETPGSVKSPRKESGILEPPVTIPGILKKLGPGLIVAGSIVGSGELIATTATGAQAGYYLLWLILIGCVIKVFVQVEMGRYAITAGKTTMSALDEVPGPRIPGRGNWLVWYWFVMFLASIAQLGGIVGGVGQALAISAPLTSAGTQYNAWAAAETDVIVLQGEMNAAGTVDKDSFPARINSSLIEATQWRLAILEGNLKRIDKETQPDRFQEMQSQAAALQATQKILKEIQEKADGRQPAVAHLERVAAKLAKLPAEVEDKPSEKATQIRIEIAQHMLAALTPAEGTGLADADSPAAASLVKRLREISTAAPVPAAVLKQTGDRAAYQQLITADGAQELKFVSDFLSARSIERVASPLDDKIWAAVVAVITAIVLVVGRYNLIQSFSTAMVASFTLITIVNLFMLQSEPSWAVSVGDILLGMSFRLGTTKESLATALATFGIIGVGASELVTYPYWCLEKGYGKYTGPRVDTPEWTARAAGWLRVMRWDAWCSMVVYTFATIAFYLLGASILHRSGLNPGGNEMIRYLAVMYEPAFGPIAESVFLFGAFAVLYSTFFVANASHARVFSDATQVLGFSQQTPAAHQWRVRVLSGLFPFLCLFFYVAFEKPQALVLLSGIMQAVMLPMLAIAALYFRYFRGQQGLTPGKVWDVFLWVSAAGMSIAGVWAGWTKIKDYIDLTWFTG